MICFFTDIKKAPSTEFKSLIRYGIFLSLVVLSSLVTLIILAPQFLERIILTDYRDLYASYEQSLSANFRYYGNSYGWLIWLLMLLGFSAGTLSRVMVRPVGFFIVSFGSISLIQWAISSKQLGPHYLTHFTFLIILGIAVLFWTILLQFKTRKSFVIVNIIILLLISNFLIGLTNIGKFNNLIRPLFATNTPPLVREDYEEVSNLIEYLRKIQFNNHPALVGLRVGGKRSY